MKWCKSDKQVARPSRNKARGRGISVGTCDRSTRTKCEHWLVTADGIQARRRLCNVTVKRIARGKIEWKRFQRMFEGFYGGEE